MILYKIISFEGWFVVYFTFFTTRSQDFSYSFSHVLIQCYTFSCLIAEAIS